MNSQREIAAPKPENPFLGLIFNIFLPVAILNKGTQQFGEDKALLVLAASLALPIGYGLYDYFANARKNYVSLFGVVNVAFTGGLALFNLEGFWFAVKEAAFPFLLGVAVWLSGVFNRPFLKTMLWNPQVFDTQKISDSLLAHGKDPELRSLFKTANLYFALSFFLSSLLNFLLALRIFKEIDPQLSDVARQQILNEQIAQMTWQGYVVIALPLMILMMILMWMIVRSLQKETGLQLDQIFKNN